MQVRQTFIYISHFIETNKQNKQVYKQVYKLPAAKKYV